MEVLLPMQSILVVDHHWPTRRSRFCSTPTWGGWATGYTFGPPDEFFVSLQKLHARPYCTLHPGRTCPVAQGTEHSLCRPFFSGTIRQFRPACRARGTGDESGVLNFFIPGGFERNMPAIVERFAGNQESVT